MSDRPVAVPRALVRVLSTDARIREAAVSLSKDRFEVYLYEQRSELLDGIASGGCDVAAVDLHPSGFSAVRDLKQLPGTPNPSVVMFCEREQDRWLCAQAGADVVLLKPLSDTTALLNAIDSISNSLL